jgi:hypothetical protein
MKRILFVLGTALVFVVVIWPLSRRHPLYCPLGSFSTRMIRLDCYLRLDDSLNPEYVEIRRTNMLKDYWARDEEVFARIYGAEFVSIDNSVHGCRLNLFRDLLDTVPDSVLMCEVDQNIGWRYVEVQMSGD